MTFFWGIYNILIYEKFFLSLGYISKNTNVCTNLFHILLCVVIGISLPYAVSRGPGLTDTTLGPCGRHTGTCSTNWLKKELESRYFTSYYYHRYSIQTPPVNSSITYISRILWRTVCRLNAKNNGSNSSSNNDSSCSSSYVTNGDPSCPLPISL